MPRHIDDLDAAFSLYVRVSAAIAYTGLVSCATCGAQGHYSSFDNGHFAVRQHMSTRFDTRNCAPQCVLCNQRNLGEPEKFAMYIDRVHGEGTADTLRILARQVCKRTMREVKEMARDFRQEVARIKKAKGI